MKKMNNTKANKVSKKARIGIAALAAIMTLSFAAPLTANAATLRENESRVAAAADGNKDDGNNDFGIDTTDVTKWTISIIKDDDKMKTLLQVSEKAVQGIVKKFPEVGYVAGPMMEMLHLLYNSENPETTLGTISKQLEEIQGQIEDAKADIIEAMGTMSDMEKFIDQYNLFNAKYELDDSPIEEGCGCPTCARYSRAYLRHLLKAKEMLGMRLCVQHNLYFYNNMMQEIRDALDKGEFATYKKRRLEELKNT